VCTYLAVTRMNMTWSQVVLVLLPVVVGAVIGCVPTIMVERSRHRTTIRTRWDTALEEAAAEFAATVRRILDLTESPPMATEKSIELVRGEHGRLQQLMAEIRLLAAPPLQLAARRVVRHAWALRVFAETDTDPHGPGSPAELPRERALTSLFDFYAAARRQLQVPHADQLVPLNPAADVEHKHRRRVLRAKGGDPDDQRELGDE